MRDREVEEAQIHKIQLEAKAEIEKHIDKCDDLTRCLLESKETINQLEDSIKACKLELGSTTEAMKETESIHQDQLSKLESDRSRLQSTLDTLEQHVNQKEEDFQALSEKFQEEMSKSAQLEEENNRLKTKITGLEKTVLLIYQKMLELSGKSKNRKTAKVNEVLNTNNENTNEMTDGQNLDENTLLFDEEKADNMEQIANIEMELEEKEITE